MRSTRRQIRFPKPFRMEVSNKLRSLLAAATVAAGFFIVQPALAAADCGEYGGGAMCLTTCSTGFTPVGSASNCQGICCASTPSAPAPASTAGGGTGSTASTQSSGAVSLYALLPAQTQACMKTGNCTLDDIVYTGAAFANLLTQLSAALFFGAFVYGGAMYLLSFGDSSRVKKGKQAIIGAAIGMAIVLGAWTLVNYVAYSLLGKI